ncbi:hypothetical protein PHSC3_001837 [Chlamydiales bacterium STE3]|nr:hypothetical protein PHSC3_001837 [Chlamydiales bacterium STE3]
MIEELFWTYALNLIVNSFLAFLTTAFLIQLLICVCRVQQPRLKAILLCIPLLKLFLDPFLYDFQNWALMYQMNPLEAEAGSRMLSAVICFPTPIVDFILFVPAVWLSMNNGQTFTPADMVALTIAPSIAKRIIIIVGAVSFVLFGIYLFRLCRSARALFRITKNASDCRRAVQNQLLIRKMKQTNSKLITSFNIGEPCAFGIFRKQICFPSQLIDKLSQDEFEAIIAHELDHLRWYDGLVRVLCHLACTLFWWVPTGWWLNRVKFTQETACDAKVSKFSIAKLDLASAIIKTAKATRRSTIPLLSTCFIQDRSILKRLQPLLEEPFEMNNKFKFLQIFLVGFIAESIFFGRFWIF